MSRGLTTAGLMLLRSASASSEMALPAAPLERAKDACSSGPAWRSVSQLDQRVFDQLHLLVELVKLLLELDPHFGAKVVGLARVEHELKPVVGKVQRSCAFM